MAHDKAPLIEIFSVCYPGNIETSMAGIATTLYALFKRGFHNF